MKDEDFQFLQSIMKDLQKECNAIDSQIQDSILKVQEADLFTCSILENEDSDYKYFSPRSAENIRKSEIEKIMEDKSSYKQQIRMLSAKKEELSDKMKHISRIIKDENESNYNALYIQEEDRQRIARDLHDTSLQNLAHLVHKIELSSLYIDKDPLQAKLELSVVSKNLRCVIEEIRNTIFDLRPMTFDDLGLKAALERLICVLNENKMYETDIEIEDVSCENNIILVSIYRVIQECITNINKHAQATKMYVHCKVVDNDYCVNIKDNGRGFERDKINSSDGKHFGLSMVKERIHLLGGSCEVESNRNGTSISMRIPIK